VSSRQALDSKASGIMFGLCILWGLQQVVLKLAAPDISAVMQIALRSGLSALMVYPMIKLAKGTSLWGRDYLPAGVLVGLLFAAEFFLVAQALRFTSAAHTVVLLYTAPIFVALGLHWKLPSERLSLIQWLGIACAFFGIVIAFLFCSFTSGCEFGNLGRCFSTFGRGIMGSHNYCSAADETSRSTCPPNFVLSALYRIFSVIACGFFHGTSDDSLVCIIPYKFTFPYRCRVICQLSDLVLAVEKIFGLTVGCLFFFDPNLWDVFWCGVTQ